MQKTSRRLTTTLALLIGAGISAACATAEPTPEIETPTIATGDTALDGAMKRWAASRPASYEFTVSQQCFCPPEIRNPVVVTVRGDSIVSRTYVGTGAPLDTARAPMALTVDGLFAKIRDARARSAAAINVTYHATLGYPTQLWIDYSAAMADEEVGFEARDLRAR